jgi:1-deoxy-D-xylulose-5-phosphate reductoisomerase
VRVAAAEDADTVVVAVAGAIGIRPTHAAIEAGKQIALASKEVLVASGEATMELAGRKGVAIVPIDSEHSAIFQCLRGADPSHVDRLILTASGGPFRDTPVAQMQAATPEDALNHPTWSMGGLVTINSATLMNKGLEIIEACRLFSLPAARIEVLVHPQSIVHSLVRFVDGSVLAQLGLPDMRLPIQYALLFPDRIDGALPRLDLAKSGPLTFAEPDGGKFPAISVARQALEAGGTMPCVMNAANEAAVDLFLKRLLPFPGIIELVQAVMARHTPCSATYESVLEADAWARREATQLAHDGG